jgi:hypothetical protein
MAPYFGTTPERRSRSKNLVEIRVHTYVSIAFILLQLNYTITSPPGPLNRLCHGAIASYKGRHSYTSSFFTCFGIFCVRVSARKIYQNM